MTIRTYAKALDGLKLITQPDGLFCLFNGADNLFVAYDATLTEIIDYFVNRAYCEITARICSIAESSIANKHFTLPFDEALELARTAHGDEYAATIAANVLKLEAING